MTTSGTTNFFLPEGDLFLGSLERAGIMSQDIERKHVISAKREVNLELQSWSLYGINLWAVDLKTITLSPGTGSYTLPSDTISTLDVYVSVNGTDRLISPISRTDYASMANKTTTGVPTSYWFNRQTPSPILVLWPIPDQAYALSYYRLRQLEDVNGEYAETPDVPYRFLDALTAGLAKRLSLIYNVQKFQLLKSEAQEAFDLAYGNDSERVPLKMAPDLSSYYR